MNEDPFIRQAEVLERIATALEKMANPAGAGDKVVHVTGYTIGEYKDKEGGSFQPCVFLWKGPPLKYAIATVYPEKFDQLPFAVGKAEWTGGPLDEELARKKNVFRKWEADIILTPKMAGDEPKLTEKGNVVYKFVGVQGVKPPVEMTPHQKLIQQFDQLGMSAYSIAWKEKREAKEQKAGKTIEQHTDEELKQSIQILESMKGRGGK